MFQDVLPCAVVPASLHSKHFASAVCTFCRYNGSHCLPVRILHYSLLILCAFTFHFAYYHITYHFLPIFWCYPLLIMYTAWPPACCLASVMPCCCWIAALPFQHALHPTCCFGYYLSFCFCHAALQLPFCIALSPCFTIIVLPYLSDIID